MAIEYATSKAAHTALKRLLSPWFVANGWKKRPGTSCAFLRPAVSGFWCLWVQLSRWGSSLSGNSFTLNLVRQESDETKLYGSGRVLADLSDEDRRRGFAIAQEVAARIPVPPPSHPVYEWARLPGDEGERWRRTIADLQTAKLDGWKPGIDRWLPYYTVIDLEQWVVFLLPRLPDLLRLSDDG